MLQHRLSEEGKFEFGTLRIARGGVAEFQKILKPVEIDTALLKVQYEGELYVHHALIESGYGIVESEGMFLKTHH